MKKLLITLAVLLSGSIAAPQLHAEEQMNEYQVTFLSSRGECNEQSFSNKDLADSYLLDHIRGAMSFGHKAFAVVKDERGVRFVIVEDNCTEWLSPNQFFYRVNVKDYLGEQGPPVNLQIALNND